MALMSLAATMPVGLQQRLHRLRPRHIGVLAADHRRGEPVLLHPVEIATATQRRLRPASAVEVHDPPVSQLDEVVDGQLGTRPAVIVDRVDRAQPRRPGHQHHRHLVGRRLDLRRGDRGPEQRQPGRAERQQTAHRLPLPGRGTPAGVDDQLETFFAGHRLQPVDDFGEERVVQVGDHHAEHGRRAGSQRPGHGVRRVAELLRGLEHRVPTSLTHVRRAAHDQRDQRA